LHSITFELFLKFSRRRLCRRGTSTLAEDYLHALSTLLSRSCLGFDPRMIRQAGSVGCGVNLLHLVLDGSAGNSHACGYGRLRGLECTPMKLASYNAGRHDLNSRAFGPGARLGSKNRGYFSWTQHRI
jgi:hypothetical protein